VNGIILENGADRDVAAVSSAVAELQFEDEDDEAYCNKVRQMTDFHATPRIYYLKMECLYLLAAIYVSPSNNVKINLSWIITIPYMPQ